MLSAVESDAFALDALQSVTAALAEAEYNGDRAALDTSLASGFTAVRSDGSVLSREEFLLRARGRRRLGILARTVVTVETSGGAAVVTCTEEARTPGSGERDGDQLRTRLVFVREGGAVRLFALDRVPLQSPGAAVRRQRLRLLSWLSAVSALLFLAEGVLFWGVSLPFASRTTLHPPLSPVLGGVDTLAGVLLGLATYGLFAHGHCRHARVAWRVAAGAGACAVLAALTGLCVVASGGSGPAIADAIREQVLLLAVVVCGLVALHSPAGRAAVRPDALADL